MKHTSIDFSLLTRSEHGIQQQYPSLSNVFGDLGVEQLGLARLLVTLNEDLANTHGAAALAQTLLHGLARPHDRHTADLALEREAIIVLVRGRDDGVLHGGEVVEALLHQQPDDPVRVEDEVSPVGSLVTDFPGPYM